MTDTDWSLIEDPRVASIVLTASRKVGRAYEDVTTVDDQMQEATLHVAMNADRVREYLADEDNGERHLYRWLHSRLLDGLKTPAARSNRSVSYEVFASDEAA